MTSIVDYGPTQRSITVNGRFDEEKKMPANIRRRPISLPPMLPIKDDAFRPDHLDGADR